jgi:hypothetical protein
VAEELRSTSPIPLFILSLPRSGSTLLQRLLGAHGDIATVNEPHFLLPLLYAVKEEGVFAEYGHWVTALGVQDFIKHLPNGNDDFNAAIRGWAKDLYARAAGRPVTYFLDKTPKYSLVTQELVAMFPDSPFVILWRNPLANVASLVETFGGGSWNLDRFAIDVHVGLERLVELSERPPPGIKLHTLRYEDLVTRPAEKLGEIFTFLGLEQDAGVLDRFGDIRLAGRISDPNSRLASYGTLRTESLEKWKATLASPLRARWCRRYLRWIGRERLRHMGYDLDDLLHELAEIPTDPRIFARDLLEMPYRRASDRLESYMLRKRYRVWREGRRWYGLR